MITGLKSPYSRIIFLLAVISIIITTIKYFSLKIFFIQAIIYYLFMYRTDCNIYGKCYINGYINVIVVGLLSLFFIFDYFGVFKEYKRLVRSMYDLYESSNLSQSSNLKKILSPSEDEVSDFYKKRKIPGLLNHNFKHKSIDEELGEEKEKNEKEIRYYNNIMFI